MPPLGQFDTRPYIDCLCIKEAHCNNAANACLCVFSCVVLVYTTNRQYGYFRESHFQLFDIFY